MNYGLSLTVCRYAKIIIYKQQDREILVTPATSDQIQNKINK
jgi:hypothetical protein